MFIYSLYILSAVCAVLYFYTRVKLAACEDQNFIGFQRTYLLIYLLGTVADWLQGPHVYALYEYYGMTKHQIEFLFIVGFGSSMLFGTFIGSIADKFGRRLNCIVYGILYGLACITKHFGNFYILLVGRFLGGIATSILFSAFESWLVYEHNKRGFSDELLATVFSHAVLGNSVVAILAGISAQFAADKFGFVAPFDLSLTVLIVMCILLVFTWSENYGDSKAAITKSFVRAWEVITKDRKVLCLGFIQSLFEGSMYVFVLEWTPALASAAKYSTGTLSTTESSAHRGAIPHGYIFAAFMVAVMIGSSLFKLLSNFTKVESFMRFVLLISAVMLYIPVHFATNELIVYCAFIVFEVCVGLFWPAMGYMRGKYVPEESRATVMNFFRVPLNFIVVIILLQDLPLHIIFTFCAAFLSAAVIFQHWLYQLCVTKNSTVAISEDIHSEPENTKEPEPEVALG